MAVIPMRHDVTAAAVAAACSSTAVAPFLMCVDRAVVAAAAGTAPGGSLFRAIAGVAGEFVTKPKTAFAQPALWMVAGVYGGTYLAKNVSDVCIERRGLSETHKGANAAKFAATTACNMGGSILKDAAFAKLYGAAVAAVVLVPPASYALFAARDCLTIGGAFVVPDALAAGLTRATGASRETAATVSQLVSPPLMQIFCTPLHLTALDMVNAPNATAAQRMGALAKSGPAALLARSLRMLPAYGVGGLLNATLCRHGREAASKRRWRELVSEEWDVAVEGFGAESFSGMIVEGDVDELFGDDFGEHALHALAFALHGGVHPVALATKVQDPTLWKFRWERLIQRSVSSALAENGGDTFGGCVVVGGDAEIDAAVDAFVKRLDNDGDGLLSIGDILGELEREKRAGEGWAAKALASRAGDGVAAQFVEAADADGDGKVSAEEIKRLLRRSAKE
uniref:EF-hand domain-containing protein n=1 Tax=Micromonas pusilla TaxID=38833 RepID=A0A7S0D4F5_MICPS